MNVFVFAGDNFAGSSELGEAFEILQKPTESLRLALELWKGQLAARLSMTLVLYFDGAKNSLMIFEFLS